MEITNLKEILNTLNLQLKELGSHFDLEKKNKRISEIKLELQRDGIWNDIDYLNSLNRELSLLQKSLNEFNSLVNYVKENILNKDL